MPTFLQLVTKETLSALVDYYIDLSKESNAGISGKLGSWSKSLFGKALGRDVGFAKRKEAIMKRFLTGSQATEMERWSEGENIPALSDYPRKEHDSETMAMYNENLVKHLFNPLDALFQSHASDVANEGQTPELRRLATQKVNDVYRLCDELGLLDTDYNEDDAVHRFAYIALWYLNVRADSDQSLAKGKCELVRSVYTGLKKRTAALRDDAEVGVYEETVISAINDLMREHDQIRDKAAYGVDVPLNVSFFTIAKAKLKYTPGAGELGKGMTELLASVKKQLSVKEEAAAEREREISATI